MQSETEVRWITMGISGKRRLLILIHTFRQESDDAVRIKIISSRKATKQKPKLIKYYDGKRNIKNKRHCK
ncbi:MAG: BrnT family toxin [Thermodesulfobacteriota bacterium]